MHGRHPTLLSLPPLSLLLWAVAGACGCGGDDAAAADGGASRGDGGPGVDGGMRADGGGGADAGPTPSCGDGDWATYAHDPQRTSASDACIDGPLSVLWRYVPEPTDGRDFRFVGHAVATADGVYLEWAQTRDAYLGTTAMDRVALDGTRAWSWDSGSDANLGHWPSLAFDDQVVMNEDQIAILARADGTRSGGTGVDYWGLTAYADGQLYLVNDAHIDGPGIFVGAVDADADAIWRANESGSCRIDAWDRSGGAFAVDGGTLFYAPIYEAAGGAPELTTGLYSFDGADGTPGFTKPVTPSSRISAGGGNVYLVEDGTTLTARSQGDGSVVWTQTLSSPGVQAPVLAAGRVIVADATGVHAFDAATGDPAWTADVTGAASRAGSQALSGGCMGTATLYSGTGVPTTTLAAALASGTLVVTSAAGISILSLDDGSEVWSGAVDGAMGAVREPVLVGDRMYVLDSGGLIALSGG